MNKSVLADRILEMTQGHDFYEVIGSLLTRLTCAPMHLEKITQSYWHSYSMEHVLPAAQYVWNNLYSYDFRNDDRSFRSKQCRVWAEMNKTRNKEYLNWLIFEKENTKFAFAIQPHYPMRICLATLKKSGKKEWEIDNILLEGSVNSLEMDATKQTQIHALVNIVLVELMCSIFGHINNGSSSNIPEIKDMLASYFVNQKIVFHNTNGEQIQVFDVWQEYFIREPSSYWMIEDLGTVDLKAPEPTKKKSPMGNGFPTEVPPAAIPGQITLQTGGAAANTIGNDWADLDTDEDEEDQD